MSNIASRAMLGITAPFVANRSPAVNRTPGSSSSVENATKWRSMSMTSAASNPRSCSGLNAANSSRLRAKTTPPGPSRSPSEIIGLPSEGSGPWVTNSSSVEKNIFGASSTSQSGSTPSAQSGSHTPSLFGMQIPSG